MWNISILPRVSGFLCKYAQSFCSFCPQSSSRGRRLSLTRSNRWCVILFHLLCSPPLQPLWHSFYIVACCPPPQLSGNFLKCSRGERILRPLHTIFKGFNLKFSCLEKSL